MTRRTFYKKLKEIAPSYYWYVSPNGDLRGRDNSNVYFCPIVAVCNSIHGTWYHSIEYYKASDLLALSSTDRGAIVGGADQSNNVPTRRALLRAVGLTNCVN